VVKHHPSGLPTAGRQGKRRILTWEAFQLSKFGGPQQGGMEQNQSILDSLALILSQEISADNFLDLVRE